MTKQTAEQLLSRHCVACEGGLEKLSEAQLHERLESLVGWELIDDGQRIRRDWRAKDFLSGMEFFGRLAELAEQEGHHPDLHLEDYRHVWIALSTHAIGGLSENDFIMAAKIDQAATSASLSAWDPR
jgi:4a-hydroxytetrahydrobiopterin dehydratase